MKYFELLLFRQNTMGRHQLKLRQNYTEYYFTLAHLTLIIKKETSISKSNQTRNLVSLSFLNGEVKSFFVTKWYIFLSEIYSL